MPVLADNNAKLIVDGVTVDAYFKNVQLQRTSESVDVTGGAGVDHMLRSPGLIDTQITITVQYETALIQTYIQHISAGQVVVIEYGPEGATSGKPRHVQSFLITSSNASEQNVAKDEVTFEITGEGAAAPSVDMYAGGVYS